MATKKTTEKPPPNYSTEPCPNCGSLLVRPDVAAVPDEAEAWTLEGHAVKNGDKVRVCDGCGQIVGKAPASSTPAKGKAKRKAKPKAPAKRKAPAKGSTAKRRAAPRKPSSSRRAPATATRAGQKKKAAGAKK